MKNFPEKVQIYIITIDVIGFITLLYFTCKISANYETIIGLLFFSVIAIMTDTLQVPMPKGGYVTVTTAVTYACLLLFDPAVAIYVSIIGTIVSKFLTKEEYWYKVFFNCAQFTISIGVAGFVYNIAGGHYWNMDLFNLLPFVLAAVTYYFINTITVAFILAWVNGVSPWVIWLFNIKWSLPNLLALSPMGLLMAYVYKSHGPIAVSLFFIPLLLARFIFKSYMDMRQVYLDTLAALVDAMDAKDRYTRGHSERVARYAAEIARELKLPEDQVEMIEHSGLLHDVGKIGIHDELLTRAGRLEHYEYDHVKKHAEIGAKIINEINLGPARDYILYHHEKYNGTGYPAGLTGADIPLGARIISVADSFDAMTSSRGYRVAMSRAEALLELERGSGIQFDPEIVKIFITTLSRDKSPFVQTAGENTEVLNI